MCPLFIYALLTGSNEIRVCPRCWLVFVNAPSMRLHGRIPISRVLGQTSAAHARDYFWAELLRCGLQNSW